MESCLVFPLYQKINHFLSKLVVLFGGTLPRCPPWIRTCPKAPEIQKCKCIDIERKLSKKETYNSILSITADVLKTFYFSQLLVPNSLFINFTTLPHQNHTKPDKIVLFKPIDIARQLWALKTR